jgi:hypothetical protein
VSFDSFSLGTKVGNAKQVMPPGYVLWWLEGHYLWRHDNDIDEGAITVDRWQAYREAWVYYHKRKGTDSE